MDCFGFLQKPRNDEKGVDCFGRCPRNDDKIWIASLRSQRRGEALNGFAPSQRR